MTEYVISRQDVPEFLSLDYDPEAPDLGIRFGDLDHATLYDSYAEAHEEAAAYQRLTGVPTIAVDTTEALVAVRALRVVAENTPDVSHEGMADKAAVEVAQRRDSILASVRGEAAELAGRAHDERYAQARTEGMDQAREEASRLLKDYFHAMDLENTPQSFAYDTDSDEPMAQDVSEPAEEALYRHLLAHPELANDEAWAAMHEEAVRWANPVEAESQSQTQHYRP